MKIKPEHIAHMRAALAANRLAPTLAEYIGIGLSPKRWRWDLAYMAGLTPWICDTIYCYANDDHIVTALRHILCA